MLVFLHGFLGQKEDWDPLFAHLPTDLKRLAIDLPGHGNAPFDPDIIETVYNQIGPTEILVGYSAGGRLALELKSHYPKEFGKVIAVSAHPGLTSEEERKKRWEIDQKWIEKLRRESFETFLQEWYDQPLFQTLKECPHFPSMIERRKNGDPTAFAQFLETFSTGKKRAPELYPETFFLFGEEDLKYAKLYHTLPSFGIPNAGHAIHLENPKALAKEIENVVSGPNHLLARSKKIPRYQIP